MWWWDDLPCNTLYSEICFDINSHSRFLLISFSRVHFPILLLLISLCLYRVYFLWWHTEQSCFVTQSDNLCLLIGIFPAFTFNIVIDKDLTLSSCYSFLFLPYIFVTFLLFLAFFFIEYFLLITLFYLFCYFISYNSLIALRFMLCLTDLLESTFKWYYISHRV